MILSSPTQVPPVPPLACLGILIGMLPAFLAPPLPRPAPTSTDGHALAGAVA